MVLVTSGCESENSNSQPTSTSNRTSQSTPKAQDKIDFISAQRNVQEALDTLQSSVKTGRPATVKQIKEDINRAVKNLGKDEEEIKEKCVGCSEEEKRGATEVLQILVAATTQLGKDSQEIADLDKKSLETLQQQLSDGVTKLSQLGSTATTTPTQTPSASPTEQITASGNNDLWLWNTLMLFLKILGGVVTLVLLASVLNYLWTRSWKTLESNVGQLVKAHVAAARDGQPDYAPKLSSLASTQTDINAKLNELDTEVRSLARLIRDSLARRSDRNPSSGTSNYQSYAEDVSPKDEPEFPVSAVNYLDKMNRFANVVKPDFQNGILVNDPEGDGELVLIRDPRLRDETQPLFVIPRATQFHTKQDFYTYYQKYYDCVRPTAGDVWIIGPAVVEKVTGGWQLREKGMLEVR